MDSSPKHILITDNDPITRRLFGSLLANAGYEVLYAKDGEEGREIARRLHPDLILMDINMPGEDGFQTASRIKFEPASPAADIPIVFLSSADLSNEAQKWMIESGVSGYIHKGATNEEFVAKVKQLLEGMGMPKTETPKAV